MEIQDDLLQILVVEDDEVDRRIMKSALRSSGIRHALHFAEDHESGKEMTSNKEYDCIFLDYNLPGGSGLELLMAIRKANNQSPIIIVTSHGDEKLAVEAMKNGANDYIPKSLLTPEGIAQSVRYMVNMKEKERTQRELEMRLRETQEQLNTVVANAPIILFALDNNCMFRLFEGKGLTSLGIFKGQFIDKQLKEDSYLPLSIDCYRKALQGTENTEVLQWENKFFEVFYSPIRDASNTITGVIGVASDVTSHKEAEKELLKAKKLAEETAKIKEQFLANMSHEIRTPMNGIIGLTRILLNTQLTHEQTKYLQSIKTCSDNLLVIINDILDFSKIEAGKMSFEEVSFSIQELAHHTIELFQSKADEKSLRLVSEIDPGIPGHVMGDPTRLSQILNNLVSNAIKFTETGEIRLRIRLTGKSDTGIQITFEVKDTGIGIPESSLASIFDSFTQASSDTTRKFGGTGLGLTIVRQLVELQKGEITVRSKQGHGTTFSFFLSFVPVVSNAEETTPATTDTEGDLTGLRVLIAEDNAINQMIIKKVFTDWNVPADLASNGNEAVNKLAAGTYDIVLMDIQMPEMDGYTAARTIRQMPAPHCNVPIMAMTAHATASEQEKCRAAGMNDHISKPFDMGDLKKKILALTKSSKATLKDVPAAHTQGENDTTVRFNTPSPSERKPNQGDYLREQAAAATAEKKINLTYLKQIADGNDTFIIEMIEMFLNKTPQALEEMNACFNKQNWEELRQIAHRIKPSFGYIGLSDIQTALAEIERFSEDPSDSQQVVNLLAQVKAGSQSAFDQLRKELVHLK